MTMLWSYPATECYLMKGWITCMTSLFHGLLSITLYTHFWTLPLIPAFEWELMIVVVMKIKKFSFWLTILIIKGMDLDWRIGKINNCISLCHISLFTVYMHDFYFLVAGDGAVCSIKPAGGERSQVKVEVLSCGTTPVVCVADHLFIFH